MNTQMEDNAVRFACNGCGACCKGRLIPLTLSESKAWLQRGHDVAVLLEAFDESSWPDEPARQAYNAGRAGSVSSGAASLKVIAILAGNALSRCPNLDDQDQCGIYAERPLVCRIYPMEVNPFIELKPAQKGCPPEVWQTGEIIFTDHVVDPLLARQIDQSRSADREDATAKVALCESMDMTVAAWKDHALAVYWPDRARLTEAIQRFEAGAAPSAPANWSVRVNDPALRQRLHDTGAEVAIVDSIDYLFHVL
jgi:Fe-S-cluster containining protein